MSSVPGRLLTIDALRGIAAVSVMLHHFVGRVDLPLSLFDWGYVGVGVFFVLSGYVIAMSVGRRQPNFAFLGRFALRRSVRLDVPYWASIAIMLLIGIFGARFGANVPLEGAGQILAHLPYLQDILGFTPLLSVYWSLCYEIQFYLFLVLLVMLLNKAFGRLDHPLAMTVVFASILISLLERGFVDIAPRGVALVFWFNFSLGVVTYWVAAGRVPERFLHICGAAVLCVAVWNSDPFCYAAIATSAVIHGAWKLNRMDVMSATPFQFFGRISYSLYLFHNIFGWYALSVAQRYVNDWIALVIGIGVAVLSAWISYLILEKPSISLSRRIALDGAAPDREVARGMHGEKVA